jgi:hypothetical protein
MIYQPRLLVKILTPLFFYRENLFTNREILNKRAMMALRSLTCIKAPGAGSVKTPGLLFEQTW